MAVEALAGEYSTMDGIIGLIVLVAYVMIATIAFMFSSTAIIYSEWMGGKMRHPLLAFMKNMFHPLFALWGK